MSHADDLERSLTGARYGTRGYFSSPAQISDLPPVPTRDTIQGVCFLGGARAANLFLTKEGKL